MKIRIFKICKFFQSSTDKILPFVELKLNINNPNILTKISFHQLCELFEKIDRNKFISFLEEIYFINKYNESLFSFPLKSESKEINELFKIINELKKDENFPNFKELKSLQLYKYQHKILKKEMPLLSILKSFDLNLSNQLKKEIFFDTIKHIENIEQNNFKKHITNQKVKRDIDNTDWEEIIMKSFRNGNQDKFGY